MLTLTQAATIHSLLLILVARGSGGMIDWPRSHALADHRIDACDLPGLHVVPNPGNVVEIVTAARERLHAHLTAGVAAPRGPAGDSHR